MKDIIKAIEIEKIYLQHRARGEEPFHLIDKIKECGFNDLSDYFYAKQQHDFIKNPFIEINAKSPKDCVEDIFDVIINKKNSVIFVDIDYTLVWTQLNSGCDTNYCKENKIPIIPVGAKGDGTLVSTPGDFGIGICVYKNENFNLSYFVNEFVKIFKKYTDKEIVNQGNDIMYNGKKICGFTYYDDNNMFMIISPISFSEKSDLVTKICTNKTQTKEVGYIDFMTREELRMEVKRWLDLQ